ncbi:C4-dicarboxylate ABC transporter substrate-binding protein [Hydrogenophaga crassostreae]|uniref:TRAP transporter small permease protein n=1 Tax=Hydrogenophaga crassostreae TaxID=1763535 RepID=A0A162YUU4_9BURK|nr:TRAP transporter small permease protein [Hydrogenophaga crassostreae]OAD40312.1 C4-dicarboxylate ABC transporter substrate-binding protein [Hydrogenophaga crassostreae]
MWITGVQALSRALGVVAALMILVSIGVVCQMVFVRAVLGESSIWQTEFVMYSLVAATFIGAPYILLTRGHVAVDVLPLMVRPPARRALHLLGSLIALAFCGLFLYASIPWWWDAYQNGHTTSSIWRARLWIPYLAVPVGLGLLCLQYLAEIWLVLTQREHPFGLSPEDKL